MNEGDSSVLWMMSYLSIEPLLVQAKKNDWWCASRNCNEWCLPAFSLHDCLCWVHLTFTSGSCVRNRLDLGFDLRFWEPGQIHPTLSLFPGFDSWVALMWFFSSNDIFRSFRHKRNLCMYPHYKPVNLILKRWYWIEQRSSLPGKPLKCRRPSCWEQPPSGNFLEVLLVQAPEWKFKRLAPSDFILHHAPSGIEVYPRVCVVKC